MTLTVEEIGDLAKSAGFKIDDEQLGDSDRDTEYVIEPCPKDGVDNEDGTRSHYRFIAYLDEYPEEGCFGLGEAIRVEQIAQRRGAL